MGRALAGSAAGERRQHVDARAERALADRGDTTPSTRNEPVRSTRAIGIAVARLELVAQVADGRRRSRVSSSRPRPPRPPRSTAPAPQPPIAPIERSGGTKPAVVDAVPGLLAPHRGAPAVRDVAIGRAAAQQRPQVGLVVAEQARAHRALGGDPGAVARGAERARHRRDDADRGRAAVDEPFLGGRRRVVGAGRSGSARTGAPSTSSSSAAGTMLSRRQAASASSGICSMNRSSSPCSSAQASSVGRVGEGLAHEHGVDLDRTEAGGGTRAVDARRARAGSRSRRVRRAKCSRSIVSSETLMRPGPPRRRRVGALVEPDAVRRHRQRDAGGGLGDRRDDVDEVAARERLAAGEAHLAHAEVAARRSRPAARSRPAVSRSSRGMRADPLPACSRCSAASTSR